MNKEDAKKYIQEIIYSIERDVVAALNAFNKHNAINSTKIGFFAIPRMIFPEIDCLACLYLGNTEKTSQKAVKFMREYFGRVNILYKQVSGFFYKTYRHGLMHQHEPKNVTINGQNLFWQISMNHAKFHLKINKPSNHLILDGSEFLNDFLKAAKLYLDDFNKDVNGIFLKNFNDAFLSMNKPISEEIIKKHWKNVSIEIDLKFLKSQLSIFDN